jgi:signal transduction histidine kinase
MNNYKSARIKLTLLYFGIIITIVVFFSVFAVQINNAQYDRFDNPTQMEDLLQMRLRSVPPQNRADFEKREREKDTELLKQVEEAKEAFLVQLVLMDIFLLIASGLLSFYLSHETLLPILDAFKKQKKFVADASHELRTPIAAMKSETDVILRSKRAIEQDYKDTLISVNEELDVLTRLSSYLLEIARSDDQKTFFRPEELNLSKFIEKDLSKFQKIADRSKIKLESEITENITINGDPTRLEQLLRILLDNSVKYNKPEGSIKVALTQIENQAVIEISDTGIGIPKTQIEKIFDRFYRVTTDRHLKGFGLGLTIAKQVVDEHKGRIKVESKEGEWTKFVITLPLR